MGLNFKTGEFVIFLNKTIFVSGYFLKSSKFFILFFVSKLQNYAYFFRKRSPNYCNHGQTDPTKFQEFAGPSDAPFARP